MQSWQDDFPHIDNLISIRRFDMAIAQTVDALREQPENPNLHRRLSLALTYHGDPHGGERSARDAIRLEADEGASHHALAIALMSQNRFDEADAALDECHRLAPMHALFFARHAALRLVQLRHNEAAVFVRQALELDPHSAWAHEIAAEAAVAAKDYELADAHCRQSLRINPEDVDVLKMHGLNLSRLGRHGEAAAALLSAMRRNPHDEGIHEALIDALRQESRFFRLMPIKQLLLGKLIDQPWVLYLILALLLLIPMAAGITGSFFPREQQGPFLFVLKLSMALGGLLILIRMMAGFFIIALLQFDREARSLLRVRDRLAGNGAFALPIVFGVCWYLFAAHGSTAGIRGAIALPALAFILCLVLAQRPGPTRRKLWAFFAVTTAAMAWAVNQTFDFGHTDVTTMPLTVALLSVIAALAMVPKEEWR